ncbi:hypothetical protein SAMN06265371_11034 [Lutibacter agarilyticus]|uniref:GRAM domain-containing protein n=2 Tax=Lutibacter agarilyticus TaxID=1109740 RepID=A0A238YN18_9FLAO|nr:hypothetical protein SAMN06265371_11034 [Lutibacter agarilyticus]
MSWENLKIVRNMMNHDIISSDELNEEEFEITSAEAKHCDGVNKIIGELTITNKRIIFSAKSREDISLGLDEIELVKSNKPIFSMKDKLTIVGKKKENIFKLNYSEDWVSLIEQLLKTNSKDLE